MGILLGLTGILASGIVGLIITMILIYLVWAKLKVHWIFKIVLTILCLPLATILSTILRPVLAIIGFSI